MLILNLVKCQRGNEDVLKASESTPYEFGFNIEGYQHRHEKKDEKGIIMGEFGFITGDGVYHITVYATDQDGNFKIVQMKNIYIGLPMEKPSTNSPGAVDLMPVKVTDIMSNKLDNKKPAGLPGCGGCVIPIKTDVERPKKPSEPSKNGKKPSKEMKPTAGKPYKPIAITEMLVEKPKQPARPAVSLPKPMEPAPFSMMTTGVVDEETIFSTVGSTQPVTNILEESTTASPMTTEAAMMEGPSFIHPPMDVNSVDLDDGHADMVMKDSGKPVISDPPQTMITQQELLGILYKFNYSLSYHGHHETGYKNGDKAGSYFSNGADGVGVNVQYKADKFGYQPNITFSKLSESQTPNKVTPEELHGYEFKWFYSR